MASQESGRLGGQEALHNFFTNLATIGLMRRKILLVEDDAKTRATVALYLQRDGCDVSTAEDGDTRTEARSRESV